MTPCIELQMPLDVAANRYTTDPGLVRYTSLQGLLITLTMKMSFQTVNNKLGIDLLIDLSIDWSIVWLIYWSIYCWLIYWLVYWLIGLLIHWSIDSLICVHFGFRRFDVLLHFLERFLRFLWVLDEREILLLQFGKQVQQLLRIGEVQLRLLTRQHQMWWCNLVT